METANDSVGDFLLQKGVFEHPRLGIGAVKNCYLAVGNALCMQSDNHFGGLVSFFRLVLMVQQLGFFALAEVRPEVLAVTLL